MNSSIYQRSSALLAWFIVFAVAISSSIFVSNAHAADTMLVKKQQFTLDEYTTINGKKIKDVRIGWESYGTLNDKKDNVILITHFFSGNSHAAGKYKEDDAFPGYWDSIIGPGKAIDTNKFYVLSSDTLVNANAYDDNVITTGPASINPDTGKPYGLDFPVVTIRDFVNVQKALLDQLGIKKLHAVAGASMGSFQALEWAIAYPNMVERIISVIGAGKMDAWTVSALEQWAIPIKLDPNWNNGNYYDQQKPTAGLATSVAMITQTAMYPASFNARFPKFTQQEQGPREHIKNTFSVSQQLAAGAAFRAAKQDANHILYLVRASQLFMAGHNGDFEGSLKRIKAKTLFLPSTNDLLLMPAGAKAVHERIQAQGGKSEYAEILGTWGHLDGLFTITQQAEKIKTFLNTP